MHKLARSYPEPAILATGRMEQAQDGATWDTFWPRHPGETEPVQFDLLLMQDEKCAYCESRLDLHEGHIEHFRRKNDCWFPQLTFVWENLYYSCTRNGSCGFHKDRVLRREDVDLLIDPCVDDPEDFLEFTHDGGVACRSGLSVPDAKRATVTIETFNLKHPHLIEQRENMLKSYAWLKSRPAVEIDAELDRLPRNTPYLTALYHYFGRRYTP